MDKVTISNHQRPLMPVLFPIVFGLLGALFVDSQEEPEEDFGFTDPFTAARRFAVRQSVEVGLPTSSKTRFNPLWKKKRHKRRRAAQVLADAAQDTESEEEVEETSEDQEPMGPLEVALGQIDLEVEIDVIGTDVAEDMFGSDGGFGGKRHGSKIGWPHTYHKAKK